MYPFSVRLKQTHIQSFSFWGHFVHYFSYEIIILEEFEREKALIFKL